MSTLSSPDRVRVRVPNRSQSRAQRSAAAAVERARLSLVPVRRTDAPRAPFAVLVFAVLAAGVVGLLLFNTHMQQASFYATELQTQADDLTARQQKLDMELEELRDPQRLAQAGRDLGLVVPPVPAFISLKDGKVLGVPTVSTPDDYVRIKGLPAHLPDALDPDPIIKRVKAATTNPADDGRASAGNAAGTGTNETSPDTQSDPQGAQR